MVGAAVPADRNRMANPGSAGRLTGFIFLTTEYPERHGKSIFIQPLRERRICSEPVFRWRLRLEKYQLSLIIILNMPKIPIIK